MTLIKTSLLNGIAVVIKMLTLIFSINKIFVIDVSSACDAAFRHFQITATSFGLKK